MSRARLVGYAPIAMKKRALSFPPVEHGQSLVELAIGLTVLLILLAGTVDFGIGLFHYIAMRDAAQEGALYGSINPPSYAGSWNCPNQSVKNICERVVNASGASGLIKNIYDSGMVITIAAPDGACEGKGITVTLVYDYPVSMPFMGAVLGSNHIQLRTTVTDSILTPSCP
jgi:Flp pilus assembly protein TadG